MTYDDAEEAFYMDRRRSGNISFSDAFPVVTSSPTCGKIRQLRIFVDRSSIEAFDSEGKMVMTNQFINSNYAPQLNLFPTDIAAHPLHVNRYSGVVNKLLYGSQGVDDTGYLFGKFLVRHEHLHLRVVADVEQGLHSRLLLLDGILYSSALEFFYIFNNPVILYPADTPFCCYGIYEPVHQCLAYFCFHNSTMIYC